MDLIVTYAIRLWIGAILLVTMPVLPLWMARGVVRLLRLIPPLRTRLERVAARLASWTDKLHAPFMVLFYGAVLWPVLVVALPVGGITWLLFRWFVPDTPPVDAHEEHPLSPRTLDWPLRLVTITAFAQVIATAILLWLVKRPFTAVELGTLDGEPVRVDRLIILTVSAFLPAGFGLLLSGVWGSALSRALVIAIMLISTRPPVWSGVPLVLWLAFAAFLSGSGAMPVWRPKPHPPTALGFVSRAAVITLGFAAFLGAMAWTFTSSRISFPAWLDAVVSDEVFMVTPVLFLAGVDFAGMGSWIGRRVTGWTLRMHTGIAPALAAIGAAALSATFAFWIGSIDASGLWSLLLLAFAVAVFAGALSLVANGLSWLSPFDMPLALIVIIASIGGMLWLFIYTEWRVAVTAIAVFALVSTFKLLKPRADGTWSTAGLTMTAIAVMALVMAGAREVVVLTRAAYEIPPNPRTATFRVEPIDTLAGRVSAAIPTFWTSQPRPDYLYYGDGADPYHTGAFMLGIAGPKQITGTGVDGLEVTVASMLDGYPFPDLEFTTRYDSRSGNWRASQATVIRDNRRYLVDVFDRFESGHTWLLVFISGERYERYFSPTIVRVLGSWRFDDSATTPPDIAPPDLRRRVADLTGFGFLPVLFAPVGYWLLYGRGSGPPTGTPQDHAGLLAIFVAATAVMFLPDTSLVSFWRRENAASNPLATLLLMVAGVTAVLAALFALSKQLTKTAAFLRELASANVALLFIAGVYAFYGAVITLGDRKVEYEVGLFLAALVFDVFTSGREIMNGHSPRFPHPARVLSYLGYLIVVSTIVLFISTQTVGTAGNPLPKLVESEDVVRQGLVWLGAPVLILRAVLRWAESVRQGALQD